MLSTIQKLAKSEDVRLLMLTGVVPVDTVRKLEIYCVFMKYLKETGSVMQSMENTALDFNIEIDSVRYIRKRINTSPLLTMTYAPSQ